MAGGTRPKNVAAATGKPSASTGAPEATPASAATVRPGQTITNGSASNRTAAKLTAASAAPKVIAEALADMKTTKGHGGAEAANRQLAGANASASASHTDGNPSSNSSAKHPAQARGDHSSPPPAGALPASQMPKHLHHPAHQHYYYPPLAGGAHLPHHRHLPPHQPPPYETHRAGPHAAPPPSAQQRPAPGPRAVDGPGHHVPPGPYTTAQYESPIPGGGGPPPPGPYYAGAASAPGAAAGASPAAPLQTTRPAITDASNSRDGPPPPLPSHPLYRPGAPSHLHTRAPGHVHGLPHAQAISHPHGLPYTIPLSRGLPHAHGPQPSQPPAPAKQPPISSPPGTDRPAQPRNPYAQHPPQQTAYQSRDDLHRVTPHLATLPPRATRWQTDPYTASQAPPPPIPTTAPPATSPSGPGAPPMHNFYEAAQKSGTPAKKSRMYVATTTYAPPPPGIRPSIEPGVGPYRFSDPTLRRQQMEIRMGSRGETYNEVDGRQGATSPSQIEISHREEVTTMGCTCKKTKCLKLYCQCFAVKIYCGAVCRCLDCHNNPDHEMDRKEAIRNILNRNPNAFDTKFKKTASSMLEPVGTNGPLRPRPSANAVGPHAQKILAHKLGCKCRKSACMKKYCECYAGNVKCNANCRCVGCKNQPTDGAEPPPTTLSPFAAATRGKPTTGRGAAQNGPPRRKEPWMVNAAQNLAFMKHTSPASRKQARRAPSDIGDGGSMPSLASETAASTPPDKRAALAAATTPPNRPKPKSSSRATQAKVSSKQADDVNVLLMAARAMTDLGEKPAAGQPATRVAQKATAASTPQKSKPASGSNFSTPTRRTSTPRKAKAKDFRSPKRKQSEAHPDNDVEMADAGDKRNGLPRTNGSTNSSPSTSSEDGSTKGVGGVDSPLKVPKVKRSRIGSTMKGKRNLKGDMDSVKAFQDNGHVTKECAKTPNQKTAAKVHNALTPVSALSQRYTQHTISSLADQLSAHTESPQKQKMKE